MTINSDFGGTSFGNGVQHHALPPRRSTVTRNSESCTPHSVDRAIVDTVDVRQTQRVLEHPLGPLTSEEILQTSDIIRKYWTDGTLFHFKVITLHEPPKSALAPYLISERAGKVPGSIDRKSFVVYYLKNTDKLHEAVINLTTSKVESNVRLGPNIHPNGDAAEILAVENALWQHPGAKSEIAKLKLPEGTVLVCDPWIYGSDGVNDDKRLYQCYLYMRDPNNPHEEDSCHYSFPLPISPVIDPQTLEIVRIDTLPTGLNETTKPVEPWKPFGPTEYIPEAQVLREDLKPLHITQPEGVSFEVENFSQMGRVLRWQKWDFKVGFNQREGMVIYDVHYDNRPLFYRLSLSDMVIPYADPRHPFHKKAAFDFGDVGAGIMANNLSLGCDCLGSIYYISGVLSDNDGLPVEMPNVICIHEVDNGIGWKHTNYRTGRACVTRARELVVQSVITVSNYEYIMAFSFTQAGDLVYEVRASGILSTQPVDLDLTTIQHPFGTIVHEGVLAGYHQHFFSLRIDPMIDGHGNSIIYDEAFAIPRDPVLNPHGVGYTIGTTPITTSGGHDLSTGTNRVFRITNPGSRNPINNTPVSYKVMAPPMQPILADRESFHYRRAQFADRSIYVTKYVDGELYAGGKYTNQSRGTDGVRTWAERKAELDAGDAVLWVQFGMNHIPRIEDFPVMPCETMRVMLRPVNFFDRNPAIDVPPSRQEINKSIGLNGLAHDNAQRVLANAGSTSSAACCR